MVDRDHEGTILQILTKPVGDRNNSENGCMLKDGHGKVYQKGGAEDWEISQNSINPLKSMTKCLKLQNKNHTNRSSVSKPKDSTILGQEMAEQSTIRQNEQGKIILPDLRVDPTKAPFRSSGSVPTTPSGQRKPSSARHNCLCSPTTHVGSFRCRYHRNSNLTRNSLSLGAKLSELGEKQTEMCRPFQGQLIAGHNQGS